MNDFVTRLETELHQAALRRERVGAVRGAALPRLRLAFAEIPAAAVACALLGLAFLGAAVLIAYSPERAARNELPPALRGVWHAGATELHLYPRGSERCANLGLSAREPCYTLGSAANHVAHEWGELSVPGDELTLRAAAAPPGLYRWTIDDRVLRLTKLRDPVRARARALASEPLAHARKDEPLPPLPIGWTARSFTSERYGYSIRYPQDWSARGASSSNQADTFSPAGRALPGVTVVAEDLPADTTQGRWSAIVHSRPEAGGCTPAWYRRLTVGGEAAMITRYPACHGADEHWASFVHRGRGYQVLWRGRTGRDQADIPLFDALLRTVAFSR